MTTAAEADFAEIEGEVVDDDSDDFDPLAADFEPVDPARVLLEHLVASRTHADIASEMQLTEAQVDALVPQAVALGGPTWTALRGNAEGARRLIHETLDSVDRRVYSVLHDAPHTSDRVELMSVLLDTMRFRAELAGIIPSKAGKR